MAEATLEAVEAWPLVVETLVLLLLLLSVMGVMGVVETAVESRVRLEEEEEAVPSSYLFALRLSRDSHRKAERWLCHGHL